MMDVVISHLAPGHQAAGAAQHFPLPLSGRRLARVWQVGAPRREWLELLVLSLCLWTLMRAWTGPGQSITPAAHIQGT